MLYVRRKKSEAKLKKVSNFLRVLPILGAGRNFGYGHGNEARFGHGYGNVTVTV